jgi:hypothetical protein
MPKKKQKEPTSPKPQEADNTQFEFDIDMAAKAAEEAIALINSIFEKDQDTQRQ